MSTGGIIYVAGFYGAGKSTLIRAALSSIDGLRGIPTYLTRAPRPGELEDKQLEYVFVDQKEYDRQRMKSCHWDHTEIAGTSYGADADEVNRRMAEGQVFIINSPNQIEKLEEMQQQYQGNKQLIWIDTSLEVSNQRLLARDGEQATKRMNDPVQSENGTGRLQANADIIFEPSASLEEDKQRFITLVQRTLEDWRA